MSSLRDMFLAMIAAVIPGFGVDTAPVYNGYLEADYVHVAPLGAGRILTIDTAEGDSVTEGQVLVTLDDTSQTAQARAAKAGVALAQANLENLQTGSRDAEIAVIRASIRKAEADRTLAQSTLGRSSQLLTQGRVPPAQVDHDRAALASADAQIDQLTAQLKVAQLPARAAQRVAAEAALERARAEADLALSGLRDRTLLAPVSGRVERIYYEPGEVAASGAPVLSILPPGQIKAIFFLPEGARSSFSVGDRLGLSCDGCPDGIRATITRLASDPQYTPPILYSRDERARLVFRAEAALTPTDGLLPGQPITLAPAP
ncbi:HlyD family secretion protein [Phaeovulum sp.]|uniref:HlyD family secretion protein n=1 Tax=Phaeovulum sp. TaxID=2934796 RepID=UPI0039E21BA2